MNTRILLLLLFVASSLTSEVQREEGVYVLTESNFDEFVSSHKTILLEFYAPWCGHCKKLAPEYAKAAQELESKNSDIVLAKVDATTNQNLASKFDVKGYPTLKYVVEGVASEYNGGRTQSEIVTWLSKRSGPATTLLNTQEDVEQFINQNEVAIVYFGESEDDQDLKIFNSVAISNDELKFARTFNQEAKSNKGLGHFVTLFKQFDDRVNYYEGSVDQAKLSSFISENSFPTVMPFSDRAIKRVFQEQNPTIFLFSDEEEQSLEAEKVFAQAAQENKGKFVFSISQKNDKHGHYQRLAEFLGADYKNPPKIMIVHTTNEVAKFQFPYSSITVENINEFITNFKNGKLSTYMKSEEIPENNDEAVRVIVGKNFESVVMNGSEDVLLEFYAPWCGHCKNLAPIYEDLAKTLKHNKNIIIAKVDATANEIPGVHIQGFPTIKFFKNGSKNEPKSYEGDRSKEGFLKYLKENTSHNWVESNEDL